MLPLLEDLAEMVTEEAEGAAPRCIVENFTLGRYGDGSACLLGVTDVANLGSQRERRILRKQV